MFRRPPLVLDPMEVQEYVQAIHRDFDGIFPRPDVPPENIIQREPLGIGHMNLNPGSVPKSSDSYI